MSMSLEQFLQALEKTPRGGWTTEAVISGAIRRDVGSKYDCPISAVCGGDAAVPIKSGTRFGLSATLCVSIVDAADRESTHDPELRAKLLKACGL